jgi:protein-disulfide isomerase
MYNKLKIISFSLLFALCSTGLAKASDKVLEHHMVGSPDAPIYVQEYASLTCSHCGAFYEKIFPEIKEKYIDTGKVRFVLKDFPLDAMSLKAGALAQCMPKEQYYPFVKLLYKNIAQWAFSKNNEQTLLQYASLGGLDKDKAKACMEDSKILDALVAQRTDASKKYGIEATPTFIINDGKEKLVGAQSFKEFSAVFDRLLAKKN